MACPYALPRLQVLRKVIRGKLHRSSYELLVKQYREIEHSLNVILFFNDKLGELRSRALKG